MPRPRPDHHPRLLADIGATYARFASSASRASSTRRGAAVREHAASSRWSQAYLATLPGLAAAPRRGRDRQPDRRRRVRMTNRDWAFSIQRGAAAARPRTLLVVNNFTALAMALPRVGPQAGCRSAAARRRPNGVIGCSARHRPRRVGLIPPATAGPCSPPKAATSSFAPSDERELRVLQHAWKTLPRVSAERLISGPGIELIYQACSAAGVAPGWPPTIVQRALQARRGLRRDRRCFCGMLGTMASDLALTLGATGGIYVGGGIVPRLGELFTRRRSASASRPRAAFAATSRASRPTC
jgi:glucokinase